jgi:hypothetical protein
VVFDPALISYDQMLETFWQLHDPGSRPYLTQYRNAVFYLDEGQKKVAEASSQALAQRTRRPVNTPLEPAGIFTPAEDYHQKHYLKGSRPLLDVLRKRYPDQQQLFLSTDAARLNGYLGCNGDPALLGANIRSLNLPANLESDLFDALTLTCRNFKGGCALPPLEN